MISTLSRRLSCSGRSLCHGSRRFKAFTLESRQRKSLWNLTQLRERAAHDARMIPKRFFGGFTRIFVEISIRHNGFHVDSSWFASSRYIRFALSKNRLTGSNPMRRTDISPIGHPFCASSFRAPERPSKSMRGWNFAMQIGGKRDAPHSCTTSMKRPPDVSRSGKSSSRLDSFANHRFPIPTIKFYRISYTYLYTYFNSVR